MDTMNCPQCGQPLAANVPAGQLVQCPHCRKVFPAAPAPAAGGQWTPAGGYAPPPTMGYGQPSGYPQPPGGYQQPGAYQPPGGYGRRTNGFAIAALVCGILCLAPLAIIFGIIGLIQGKDPRRGGRGMAIAGIVLGLLTPILSISILLPSLNRAREQANRIKCASNMHSIYAAMYIYSTNDQQGRFPDRPEQLVLEDDLTASVFICPSTSDEPATGSTSAQRAANMASGSHDSYVYLGGGKSTRTNFNTDVILLYEPMSNHKNGFNACFADGHVEFIRAPEAAKVEAELKAGLNPPPSYRR